MNAQKTFLGEVDATKKYAILLYMSTMLTMAVIRRLMVVLGLTPCSSLPRVVRLRIH